MIKILPINILEEMTPVVLAYMIMGDGNYNKRKRRSNKSKRDSKTIYSSFNV